MKTIKVQMNDINKWYGRDREGENNSPTFDYCRKLLKEGEDPSTKLEVYRDEMLCLTTTLKEGSKWKIEETEKKGPRFRKYEPFPHDRIGKKDHG